MRVLNKIIISLLLFLSYSSFSQGIKGKIRDESGNPLSFAGVYIQNSSIGTTTNVEGEYFLELSPGQYNIVYQYVGYSPIIKSITLSNQVQEVNIDLQPIEIQSSEVEVKANEDPAYPIIRKAIKKRSFYLNQSENYSCDSYVKGNQKIQDLPDKIMGRSLGQLRKGLDSTGTGIIYLSESVSKLFYKDKKYKEIMISSKVSGDDNGFSFNSGAAMKEFNFYENQLVLGDSKLLSPIAENALISYKYRLVGTFVDAGNIVSKIEVIPKNNLGALFHGYIYIVNEKWCIHSTELKTSGAASNISLLDTVTFKQLHFEIQDGIWKLFSQDVNFNLNVFNIKIGGTFLGVFRNYDLDSNQDAKFFNAEIFKVNNDANKRDVEYWDSIRPVPLTAEELKEYTEKDSLQKIWKSKPYLDSLDRKSNRPSFNMLTSGYTYKNSFERWSIKIPSPLNTIMFNTVQGFYGNLNISFNKYFNEDRTKWIESEGQLQYGLADKQLRGYLKFQTKLNDIYDPQIRIEGGRKVEQFNRQNPISESLNSFYTLLLERNFIKLYERNFAEIQYSSRILNNFYFQANLSYQQRNPLINNSTYVMYNNKSRTYFSNNPLDFSNPPLSDLPYFQSHQHFELDLYLRIRFKQKYISYPGRRFNVDSNYPEIWINYKKGIPVLGANTNFDYLSVTVQKTDLSIGTLGYLCFRAKYARFLNTDRMEFMDFAHFSGNQTFIAKANYHWRTYQLLPYYSHSTNNWFVEGHVEHNLKGLIWNKLPLLKKLGFENLIGYHFLYTPEKKDYMEFNFAISRIGWKLIRFGRFDVVAAYKTGQKLRFGAVFSFNFSL